LPFEKVLEEVQPERDASRAPLAQVLFVLQNAPVSKLELPGLTLDTMEIPDETSKLDIILALGESPLGLSGAFEYNTDLFDASTIRLMVSHFETLLSEIVINPDRRLLDIPLLSGEQAAPATVASDMHEKFTDDQFIF
jgi:non-ribosomal peptide synthetase component F